MKILMVINGEYYAGAERVQESLLRGIINSDHHKAWVAIYKNGIFPETSGLSDTLKFYSIKGFRVFRLRGVINKVKPDVINCHSPITLLLTLAAVFLSLSPARVVYHVHSPAREDTESRIKNMVKYCIEKLSIRVLSPAVVGVSQSVIKRSGYLDTYSDVTVVANGIYDSVDRVSYNRSEDELFKLSFAGLIRPRKGFDILLSALSLLPSDIKSRIRLSVYGEFDSDSYKEMILAKVRSDELDNIVCFKGFDKNIPRKISESHVFVIPSLYGEGLPMVLLEAMSVGSAIVASEVGGIDEVLVDGKNGLLVQPANPLALSAAIEKLFVNPSLCEKIGKRALLDQQEAYSVDSMLAQTFKVFENGR